MSGMQHFDVELMELDKQIVRLGGLCHLDLTIDATVMDVLKGRIVSENIAMDFRKPFILLKGLLTLRYMVEKQCVDEIGSGKCEEFLKDTLLK